MAAAKAGPFAIAVECADSGPVTGSQSRSELEVQVSTGVQGPGRAKIEERTLRTDRWWLTPLATFLVFSAFVVYATVRAFMGRDYFAEPYLPVLSH